MKWVLTGDAERYTDRHLLVPEDGPRSTWGLRVLKLRKERVWAIRWGETTENRHLMPPDTPLDEVQAVAIALWRMK